MKPKTSIPFITAFQLLEIRWRISKLVERWSLRFLYQSLVRQSNSPCCYYTNTCLHGQKCNYTVINQSDSFRRNSADFKFVCMQVYQTLLLLRVRGSGSETSAVAARCATEAFQPVQYIKRTVRAGGCLVVVAQWQSTGSSSLGVLVRFLVTSVFFFALPFKVLY